LLVPSVLARWLRFVLLLGLGLAAPGLQAQSLESVLSPGTIAAGHQKIEHDCSACHIRGDRQAQDGLCADCHKEVREDIRQHTGFHGRREPAACRSCHHEHKGRDKLLSAFDAKSFDHSKTDFALNDKHSSTECVKCHVAGKKWSAAPHECVACHLKDDVHKNGLGRACQDCHKTKSWRETEFDHGKKTRFALVDKHEAARCDACHANGRYKETPRTCVACHRKDDEHKGHNGERCETCHGAKAWKPSTFNHDSDTHYALKDKHRQVKCNACHTAPIYKQKLGKACVDCHQKDDKHKESLGKDCAACHTERSWKEPPGFNHDKSRFPLLGKHAKTACKDCHTDTMFRQTASDCLACHRKDDKHLGSLGTACADCHRETSWKETTGRFDHQRTRFPLRNAHAQAKVQCKACHADAAHFKDTGRDCIACHRKDDKHEASLGDRCEACHNDLNWKLPRFDHSKARFALTGGHLIVKCASCHDSLRFRQTPRDCLSCHRKVDPHKGSLGAGCDNCHNTRAWPLWSFDHDKRSKFPLQGSHRTVRCQACHTAPAPAGAAIAPVGNDCYACHRKNDPHEGRFGRRCDQCHVVERWQQLRSGATKP
jgi:hypothetical protein